MKISVLQPHIVRGDIMHNVRCINRLLQDCKGSFAVLAEYALTGSLVLDPHANPREWARQCEAALQSLVIPEGKTLLVNHLHLDHGTLYNQCSLLPAGGVQRKCFPDSTERQAGIHASDAFPLFTFDDKKYKVIICSDLRKIDQLPTEGSDFAFFIFHFTPHNLEKVVEDLKSLSSARNLPVIAASLCSDKNCGHSMYVNGSTVTALGNTPSILEITI